MIKPASGVGTLAGGEEKSQDTIADATSTDNRPRVEDLLSRLDAIVASELAGAEGLGRIDRVVVIAGALRLRGLAGHRDEIHAAMAAELDGAYAAELREIVEAVLRGDVRASAIGSTDPPSS